MILNTANQGYEMGVANTSSKSKKTTPALPIILEFRQTRSICLPHVINPISDEVQLNFIGSRFLDVLESLLFYVLLSCHTMRNIIRM